MKLGKFMTDQVVNTFGHVCWPSVISTPELVCPGSLGNSYIEDILSDPNFFIKATRAC